MQIKRLKEKCQRAATYSEVIIFPLLALPTQYSTQNTTDAFLSTLLLQGHQAEKATMDTGGIKEQNKNVPLLRGHFNSCHSKAAV